MSSNVEFGINFVEFGNLQHFLYAPQSYNLSF